MVQIAKSLKGKEAEQQRATSSKMYPAKISWKYPTKCFNDVIEIRYNEKSEISFFSYGMHL